MKCPSCGNSSMVVDSRPIKDELEIRRRRECNVCLTRFTTYERIEKTETNEIQITLKSKNRQETYLAKLIT